MTQEPQAIFRGSALIAGGVSDPVTLVVSADEIALDAGLGLCYCLRVQDVVRFEVVEKKRLAIRHTLIDCPSSNSKFQLTDSCSHQLPINSDSIRDVT